MGSVEPSRRQPIRILRRSDAASRFEITNAVRRFGSTTNRSFVENQPAIRRATVRREDLAVFSPAIGVQQSDSQSGI